MNLGWSGRKERAQSERIDSKGERRGDERGVGERKREVGGRLVGSWSVRVYWENEGSRSRAGERVVGRKEPGYIQLSRWRNIRRSPVERLSLRVCHSSLAGLSPAFPSFPCAPAPRNYVRNERKAPPGARSVSVKGDPFYYMRPGRYPDRSQTTFYPRTAAKDRRGARFSPLSQGLWTGPERATGGRGGRRGSYNSRLKFRRCSWRRCSVFRREASLNYISPVSPVPHLADFSLVLSNACPGNRQSASVRDRVHYIRVIVVEHF